MPRHMFPASQRGIATLLIVMLVGLSLTAVVGGGIYYNRVNQEQAISLQAQTQAQAKAWATAEVIRGYLKQASQNESFATLLGLKNQRFTLSGMTDVTATLIEAWQEDSSPYLRVEITATVAKDSRAETSSKLELIYKVSSSTGPKEESENNRALTFMRNLNLGGSIAVKGQDGKNYEVNVKGDVTTNGNSITGISIINSTGSIDIGSGSSFDELNANGDIRLTGSVSGQQNLRARGNICLSGGASANGSVQANGSVIGNGGVSFGNILSIGSSDNTGTQRCGTLARDAQDRPFGVDLQGNSSAKSVTTKASVRINSGSITSQLAAEGDLVDTNWGGSESGWIGGAIYNTGGNPSIPQQVQIRPGQQVSITPIPLVSIETEKFNAYALENQANYVFKTDSRGYKVVTVRNIAGVANGNYFIANYENNNATGWSRGYKDYLCATLASNSTPQAPLCSAAQGVQDPPGTICKGHSTYNNCISATYDSAKKRWKWAFNGTTFAPGVAWFEGDLDAGNGTYYNTFIATGNINTSGSLTLYAPTFAGPTGGSQAGGQSTTYQGMCNNTDFPGRKPTQFCKDDGTFDYSASSNAGHFAMMAGSCSNESCSPYIGGDITLGSSNNLYGSIKAGNQFSSGGSSTIHGYITALALGTASNMMNGSTTIDLRNLPTGFDPGGGTGSENGSEGGSGDNSEMESSSQILWSRYL